MNGRRRKSSPDRTGSDFTRFLDRLSPHQREEFQILLRDPKTYVAEDIEDLLAILRDLEG